MKYDIGIALVELLKQKESSEYHLIKDLMEKNDWSLKRASESLIMAEVKFKSELEKIGYRSYTYMVNKDNLDEYISSTAQSVIDMDNYAQDLENKRKAYK